jgi:hypothetical protein
MVFMIWRELLNVRNAAIDAAHAKMELINAHLAQLIESTSLNAPVQLDSTMMEIHLHVNLAMTFALLAKTQRKIASYAQKRD